ncbi:MAG: hypothetical protein GY869_24975 [Planctomycetes bacterium]|nr:hypothetical protein [Planctomycetota bacterium]
MSPYLKMLPNLITGSRLFFALGFLILLGMSLHNLPEDPTNLDATLITWLNWSFILFVIGGLTDVLDGPIARRLKVTGKFGRTFDPLVDKIFIAGGLILLALFDSKLTGIEWWIVAVILGREIFVTIVRHLSEAQGAAFAATWPGKLKMFLQSFMIGTIIIYIAHYQNQQWALWFRHISIAAALIFTVFSGLIYLPRMKHIKLK